MAENIKVEVHATLHVAVEGLTPKKSKEHINSVSNPPKRPRYLGTVLGTRIGTLISFGCKLYEFLKELSLSK